MSVKRQTAIENHKVPNLEKAKRLSDYAVGIFNRITTKNGIKKAIKAGLVKIDGRVGATSDYIKGGELIELLQSDIAQAKPIITLDMNILYEDEYLAIVNKPAGIVVSGNKKITLENALPNLLQKSVQADALIRPEPIHRLDYATSGSLLVGKTSSMVIRLNKLFEERKVEKNYLAVTIGEMVNRGNVNLPIDNKTSLSEYKVLSQIESPKYEYLNLVELIPFTGRRNQLRIHMKEIGHPILGDQKFGQEGLILKGKGLYLHSFSLKLKHPFTNEKLDIKATAPKKFFKLFPQLSEYF